MTIPVPVPVSQFPVGTLPLQGDEKVPMVQDGVTVQIPSSAFAVFGGVLTPEATLTPLVPGTLNNVSRQGALHLFVNTTIGDILITGFDTTGLPAGAPFLVTNSGANLLTLANRNGGSLAANQMYGVTDISLPPGGSMLLYNSSTLSKLVMV